MERRKLSIKDWFFIWGLGLVGQLCWNIENVWFNTFVYDRIRPDHRIITWMVAVSAAATTFATFLMGALSDRYGKRRPFIGWGYIAWGIFTIVFGLTQYVNSNFIAVIVVVVAADSVMSFFGSTGNDAGFNAWAADLLDEGNRGQIGAAIAIHPVLGTIVGTVIGGILIKNFGYLTFFLAMGSLVILMGVLTLLFLKEPPKEKQKDKPFIRQFLSAFNFRDVLRMRELFLVFVTMAVFFVGFNVFFIHITNYFIYVLGYSEDLAGIIQGGSLLVSVLATIPAAYFINKNRILPLLLTSIAIYVGGLVLIFFLGEINLPSLIAGVVLAGAGYLIQMQTLTVWTKKLYPETSRGQFEGVRIVFAVLIPMVLGPAIASPLIDRFGIPIVVDGKEGLAPSRALFLAGAFFAIISLLPLLFANKDRRQREKRIAVE
jgi:MFS family permease